MPIPLMIILMTVSVGRKVFSMLYCMFPILWLANREESTKKISKSRSAMSPTHESPYSLCMTLSRRSLPPVSLHSLPAAGDAYFRKCTS
jgi:hypothetical protein